MSARLQRLIRGEMFPNSALGRQAPLGWPEASVQSALIFLTQFLAETSSSKSLLSCAVCRHLLRALEPDPFRSRSRSVQMQPFSTSAPAPPLGTAPAPSDHPGRAASAKCRQPFHLNGMASKLDALWETERIEMFLLGTEKQVPNHAVGPPMGRYTGSQRVRHY